MILGIDTSFISFGSTNETEIRTVLDILKTYGYYVSDYLYTKQVISFGNARWHTQGTILWTDSRMLDIPMHVPTKLEEGGHTHYRVPVDEFLKLAKDWYYKEPFKMCTLED